VCARGKRIDKDSHRERGRSPTNKGREKKRCGKEDWWKAYGCCGRVFEDNAEQGKPLQSTTKMVGGGRRGVKKRERSCERGGVQKRSRKGEKDRLLKGSGKEKDETGARRRA